MIRECIKQYKNILLFILTFIISFINSFELEFCYFHFRTFSLSVLIYGTILILLFHIFILSLVRNWFVSSFSVSTFFTFFSFVDHYIILYHGQPLIPQDIADAGTALGVVSGYTFQIDKYIVRIIVAYFVTILLSLSQYLLIVHCKENGTSGNGQRRDLKWPLAGLFCSVFSFCVIFFVIQPSKGEDWNWRYLCEENGVLLEFIRASIKMAAGNNVIKPEGYTDEKVRELVFTSESPVGDTVKQDEYPDIIFVLNESWYNLNKVCGSTADIDYMHNYNTISGAVKGYAVVPSVGGGTNRSEFELLTSNSVSLLQHELVPFSWLDFNNSLSAVTYLEDIGYSTLAAHCESGTNYRRKTVWPLLGFNVVHFIDDFEDYSHGYGDKINMTDSDAFINFERMMNELPEDKPRFGYLLTMQNHGEWNVNDSSYDKVHINDDYGNYNDDIDEYLTCIKMTDDVIPQLIEYYSKVERPTMILMVGDHAPSFVDSVTDREFNNDISKETAMRSTPFFIWTNYESAEPVGFKEGGTVDLCNLAPMAFSMAGLPDTVYYNSVKKMAANNILHSLSSVGSFVTVEGESHDPGEYREDLDRYYYLEYNSIGKKVKRIDRAFLVNKE